MNYSTTETIGLDPEWQPPGLKDGKRMNSDLLADGISNINSFSTNPLLTNLDIWGLGKLIFLLLIGGKLKSDKKFPKCVTQIQYVSY